MKDLINGYLFLCQIVGVGYVSYIIIKVFAEETMKAIDKKFPPTK